MAFSGIDGQTDFRHGLTARTAFDVNGIDIKLPGECLLKFSEGPITQVLLTGDFFDIKTSTGRVHGAFLDAYHLLIDGPCEVTKCIDMIKTIRQSGRTLVGSAVTFDAGKITADINAAIAERRRWLESRHVPHGLTELKRRTLFKALSQMKTQVYASEAMIRHHWTTPDRWPHRAMWLWDSVFHAIGWRHLDPGLAQEMISAVLDIQRQDGFIPHMGSPEGVSNITQPPVLALGVKLVNDIQPNRDWIEEIYPKLTACVEWDLINRDSDGAGLVEWAIEGDPNCRSGESGMDNSPRFDTATQLDAVDFNSFLALESELLAHFARILERPDETEKWQKTNRRLCDLINKRLWNEEIGFYVDYDVTSNTPSLVLASSGFMPLICGAASREQAERLAEHLKDPEMFGTPLPVPSIAAKDIEHYSKDMWRGPVWVNLNWLISYGFERYGMQDMADEIRGKTMAEIEKFCAKYGSIFEFYDDRREVDPPHLRRKGKCAPKKSPYHQVLFDYGWTATLYVDMVYDRET